ncbi:putative Major facilitator superfamily domain-containing protein [Seiridium unicorne]|uniref:Major facilitator superfamily domain-containing protein n=1 Tax=Seiridium unicorne TaxID=138068 RepID=A0ABR2UTE6_9PEZI
MGTAPFSSPHLPTLEIPADNTSPVTKAPSSPVTNEVKGASEPNSSHDSRPQVYTKTFLAVFAICLIYFAQLVTLVGAGAQGQTIAGHFNGTTNVVWVSVPITILTVVLGPVISQAADYWGRKWFLVSLTMFGAVGSVVIARATTMKMLIAGFTIIGVAFGAQPLLHTVTSEVLPRRWRAWGQAIDMTSNCLGTIFGLLVGGALNRANDPTSDGFRCYFLINMAWYAIAAILCVIVYNPPPLERQKQFTTAEKLAKLDWIGYLILATGLVSFSVGLSYSKNPYEWTDPRVSATFAVGLVLFLFLIGYETFMKKDGMFHHGLFTGNRNFSISALAVACEGVAFFGANTYFAFQLSVLYETDALIVGVRYSIMLIAACVGALATGWYCAVFRRVRWVTVAAFMVFLVFFVCMATSNIGSSNAVWFYPVLLGTALGMTLTTLVTAAQLSTPPDLISVASGLIISVRSLGGTVALAIYNALFTDEMKHLGENIAEAVIPDGLSPDALGDFIAALSGRNETALESIPGVTPQIISAGAQAILDTYVQAFRHVWIAAACFVALAAIVASFLFDPQQEFNMHVDEPIEKLTDSDSTDAVNR